jgi:NAD(P)-dependent dehydrogenase (short-subunit alcohol dehydrogenase family)
MLTRVSAEDYKDTGIRFYSLNPGATRTRMRAQAVPGEDPKRLKTPDKVAQFILRLVRGELNHPSGATVEYS